VDLGTVGKALLVGALVLAVVGVLFLAGSALGLRRLPGTLSFEGKNAKVFVPIGLCIVISVVGTIVLNLLFRGR
jgi:hypothetical protein